VTGELSLIMACVVKNGPQNPWMFFKRT